MKTQKIITGTAALMIILFGITAVHAEKKIDIQFSSTLTLGPDRMFFASITDVCEDATGSFFVLDRTDCTVHKFSEEGSHLLSFGRKGQGPGDLSQPSRLALTPEGQIAVCEDLGQISLFRTDGNFIRRVNLSGRLAPGFVGPDRFYAWIWRPEDQQQVLLDGNNQILETYDTILKSAFSTSLPDSSGRAVMFNYGRSEYSPGFVFSRSQNLSAISVSSRYQIRIIDQNGHLTAEIKRDVDPPAISRAERLFFREALEEKASKMRWPNKVVSDLMKNIPDHKVYFDDVLLNAQYVFVFGLPRDISDASSGRPVDIFTVGGRYVGQVEFPDKPLALSGANAYFIHSDEEGNLTLVRKAFRLIS
jgi:hypothetical protein